jgi:hypothetical protein
MVIKYFFIRLIMTSMLETLVVLDKVVNYHLLVIVACCLILIKM